MISPTTWPSGSRPSAGRPHGTPGAIVAERDWDDYSIGRATTQEHLGALDLVYRGVISTNREVIAELDDLEPVTQDVVIGQTEKLELFHWFVRAHLEDQSGQSATEGATDEVAAARAAAE